VAGYANINRSVTDRTPAGFAAAAARRRGGYAAIKLRRSTASLPPTPRRRPSTPARERARLRVRRP
jgi:hypothetical protein